MLVRIAKRAQCKQRRNKGEWYSVCDACGEQQNESVPKSLMDAGEYAENIYDYAKANDWKKADAKIGAAQGSGNKRCAPMLRTKAAA